MSQANMVLRGREPTRMHSGCAFPQRDFTYVPIAKNGSSSVLATIWKGDLDIEVTQRVWCDAVQTTHALVMLREPTARAWSAWNMLKKSPTMYPGHPGRAWYPEHTVPWDEWLDTLVKNRYHAYASATLIPQSEYLCSPVKYEYFAWDFKALAERLGFELPHINKMKVPCAMPDITPEMRRALQITYAADYAIWDLINEKTS